MGQSWVHRGALRYHHSAGCHGAAMALICTRARFKDNSSVKTRRSEDAPQKVAAIALGPSPFSFTNTTGSPIRCHASDGAVSNMTLYQGGPAAIIV